MITCTSTGSTKDVFMHRNVVDPVSIEEGDIVGFTVHWSKDDRPQASTPVWKLVGAGQSNRGPEFGQFQGVICKIMANGCGFVECPAAQIMYGRQAYIHAEIMKECGIGDGDVIAFCVHINSRGMPQVSSPTWKCISGAEALANEIWYGEAPPDDW